MSLRHSMDKVSFAGMAEFNNVPKANLPDSPV